MVIYVKKPSVILAWNASEFKEENFGPWWALGYIYLQKAEPCNKRESWLLLEMGQTILRQANQKQSIEWGSRNHLEKKGSWAGISTQKRREKRTDHWQ